VLIVCNRLGNIKRLVREICFCKIPAHEASLLSWSSCGSEDLGCGEEHPTLYCVDPLPELDDEPCYNEHYQDGSLACQVQCHVSKGALDLNDLLLGSVR